MDSSGKFDLMTVTSDRQIREEQAAGHGKTLFDRQMFVHFAEIAALRNRSPRTERGVNFFDREIFVSRILRNRFPRLGYTVHCRPLSKPATSMRVYVKTQAVGRLFGCLLGMFFDGLQNLVVGGQIS